MNEKKIFKKLEKHLLKHQVEGLKNLPTLPETVVKINRMVENERFSVKDVGQFIETEVVLSARVLRLINSAFYGVTGQVNTVTHALVLLGLDVVKGLLLSTITLDLTQGKLRGLWEHSLGCGVAAGALAKHLGVENPEELNAAGLLHDLGKVVLLSQAEEQYPEVLAYARDNRIPIQKAEDKILGVTHDEVSYWLCSRWALPDSLKEPIAFHHLPHKASRRFQLNASIVHMADILIRGLGYGYPGDPVMPELNSKAWKLLELDEQGLEEVILTLENDLENATNFAYPDPPKQSCATNICTE